MARKECLFVTEATGLLQNILVLDKQENQICTFKGGCSSPHSLSFIGDNYVAAAEKHKPLILVWSLNRQDQQTLRIVAPAPVLSLDIDQSGTFCAASCGEKILLWQVSTGHLVATVLRHYQNVNVLKFSDCGSFLLSGGGEGMVNVWNVGDLVDQDVGSQVGEPRFSFTHHTVAVADLWVGKGGLRSRFASCSNDQTCILYDLASGKSLLKIVLDVGLRAVTSDLVESALYIGAADGRIFQVGLHSPPRTVEHHVVSSSDEMRKNTFTGHTASVTCLSVTRDGAMLASGATDNSVILWDIASKNRIRTFLQKGAITNIRFVLTPRNMESEYLKQSQVVVPFKRQAEDKPCNVAEVIMNLRQSGDVLGEKVENVVEASSSVVGLQKEVDELKAMNDALYRSSMKKILKKCGEEAKKIENGGVTTPRKRKARKSHSHDDSV